MPLDLPPPIALYVSAVNRNAPQNVPDCFADDSLVRDEGKTMRGIAAIQKWMVETAAKYHHSMEPLSVTQEGQTTIVAIRMTGTFPGSPIEVPFKFVLRRSKIAELVIG